MKAKEKAKEMLNKFSNIQQQIEWTKDKQLMELCGERNEALGEQGEYYWNELAKQSAIITVNEMIKFHLIYGLEKKLEYWQEVKNEIQKL